MITIQIDSSLYNNPKLGILTADIQNSKHCTKLQELINQELLTLQGQYELAQISTLPEISAQRSFYKQLGKDPSRYRGSAEALLRRVVQGKGLYSAHTLVDINNLISLKTLHPVGSYDLARLQAPFSLRVGQAGETYKGIGKDEINIENLTLLADAAGPFGSPTSDSQRAMVTEETERVMMVIFAFTGGDLTPILDEAEMLFQEYLCAKEITKTVV